MKNENKSLRKLAGDILDSPLDFPLELLKFLIVVLLLLFLRRRSSSLK